MANHTKSDALSTLFMCLVMSMVIGGILNCIVFPIGYIFIHDCGAFMCGHQYPVTWMNYLIVCVVVFVILFFICVAAENSPTANTTNYSSRSNMRHNCSYRSSGLETDYFDSDMEGAPGFNGGD